MNSDLAEALDTMEPKHFLAVIAYAEQLQGLLNTALRETKRGCSNAAMQDIKAALKLLESIIVCRDDVQREISEQCEG